MSASDATVVIIVSVSLALLVCAVIPPIFYGHWRSNVGEATHVYRHTLLSLHDVNQHGDVDMKFKIISLLVCFRKSEQPGRKQGRGESSLYFV